MNDLSTALAEAGMAAALDHAESIDHAFQATAYMFLHKYAREHQSFLAEDVIAAAREWGLSVPVPKAYGKVFRRAAANKIIAKVGYTPSPNRHGSPTVKWHSLIYTGAKA